MRLFLIIALSAALTACQAPIEFQDAWDQTARPSFFPHFEEVSTKTLYEKVVPGTSSHIDVYNLLGAPSTISHANQIAQGIEAATRPELPVGTRQIWTYHLSEARNTFPVDPRPIEFHTVTATVLFDFQGRVLDYQVAELTR